MTPEDILSQALGMSEGLPPAGPDDLAGINPFSLGPQQIEPFIPPPPIESRPGLPSAADQKKIQEYVGQYCKNSGDYVKNKIWMWRLWDALYNDELTLNQWRKWRVNYHTWSTSQSRRDVQELLSKEESTGPADYVHSPAYLVKSFVDNGYAALFDGPEYITVISPPSKPQPPPQPTMPGMPPQPTQESPTADFAIDQRIQRLLEDKLEAASIHARLKVCLSSGPKYGSCMGKATWYQDKIPVDLIDPMSGETIAQQWKVVREGPLIEKIPLERCIVDPSARHSDVQRWRGVGHWTTKTYEQTLQGFEGDSPLYNLNRKEFIRSFEHLKGNVATTEEEVSPDYDRDIGETQETDGFLKVWEVHIRVPISRGLTEMVVKLCAEAGTDDPTSALMIGLLMGPVLYDAGPNVPLRPFAMWQFDGQDACFGRGVIQAEESILFLLSCFYSQAQENAKRTANPSSLTSAEFQAYLDQHYGGKMPYGVNFPLLDAGTKPEEVAATFPLPQFPQQVILECIASLKNELERRAVTVDVPVAGADKSRQTATGMGILQQQGQAPLRSHVSDFAHDFLTPLANCCLALMRQNLKGDQSVTMADASGSNVMAEVTEEELQNGQFKVVASISRQDALANVRATIWKDLLMNISPEMEQRVALSGYRINWPFGFNHLLELLKVDKGQNFLQRLSTFEQQLMQQNQMLNEAVMQLQQQLQTVLGQMPGPNGNGAAPTAKTPGDRGGPMGSMPSDPNTLALQMQMSQEPNMGFGGG